MEVQFTETELKEIHAAASKIKVHGARLREELLKLSDVEAPPKKQTP
jgi:hypothetical protein